MHIFILIVNWSFFFLRLFTLTKRLLRNTTFVNISNAKEEISSMDFLTFLRVIVLVNGVYSFIPRSDVATKTITLPIKQEIAHSNDISVYDPGVGEYSKPINEMFQLNIYSM